MLRGVRRSLVLLAAGTAYAGGTAAAAQHAPGAVVQPLPGSAEGAELRRHLADLAANPRSVASLIGAGRAALRVGDGEAALGFFARADEIAPGDARVKAGMASAFVLLGRGEAALRYFAEAARLGAPEAEIARDRGLAYDLTGNPRRAQQDYAMVLQRGEDSETRRRMALSLAVSGHREAGLRALDPLLRNRDRAASRTRAFVLALTGDSAGAAQAVDSAMPGQGAAMAPFLSRLAGLNPAQKAMAVHFGHFPADGRPVQMAQAVDTTPHPAAVALTGAAPAVPTRFAQQVSRPQQRTPAAAEQPRRRVALARPVTRRDDELDRSARIGPGSRAEGRQPIRPVRSTAQPAREQQQPARTAAVQPQRQQPAPAAAQPAPLQQPLRTASAQPLEIPPAMRQDPPPPARQQIPPPIRQEPQPTPAKQQPAPAAAEPGRPATVQETPPPVARQMPPPAAAVQEPPPVVVQQTPPPPAVQEPAPAAREEAPAPAPSEPIVSSDLSDIAALVQSLPAEEEQRRAAAPAPPPRTAPARSAPAQTRTAAPAARTAAPSRTAARTPAPPAHPSRHWVQIANGERSAFAFQLGRLRQAAPELLRTRQAWWARNGSSERLLVGPFATAAEARAFVTQLSRKSVAAFPWTSDSGEEVERLPAR